MKKIRKMLSGMLVLCLIAADVEISVFAEDGQGAAAVTDWGGAEEDNPDIENSSVPEEYSNREKKYIPAVFGSCKTSFLGTLPEGGYQAVIYYEGKLYIENLDEKYQLQAEKILDLELPIWGGVYLGKTYNYVVCGDTYDPDAEGGGEVYRVIKYDKKFNRISSISLCGDETYTGWPFASGNVSMDENSNILTLYTSRSRLDVHQSNIAIRIKTEDMTVYDKYGMIAMPDIHASHSFRQIIKYDGEIPVYLDLSDGFPERSVYIQFKGKGASLLDIGGESGDNATNAEVSGLAISDTDYLAVGTYLNPVENNIFLSCIDKETREVKQQWLTNSTSYKPKCVYNPRIIQITADRFAVIWGSTGEINYVLVDGKGNIVSELKKTDAYITDCEPIYDNGKILWISADGGMLHMNEIVDFSENGVYELKDERVKAVNAWDGKIETGWYDTSKIEFDISTAQQLAGLAELVNSGNTFEGKKINLTNDIFLNDESYQYPWTPIGCEIEESEIEESDVKKNIFQGTFNGNLHKIYNMWVDYDSKGGLFGHIGEKGAVKCVDISQGELYSGGCIANLNEGIISFCNNYSLTGSYDVTAGGICNKNYNLVYGCKNYGDVWGRSAGGIVGVNATKLAVVSQCSNHGLVEASQEVAGIVIDNYGWIYNCYNKGFMADGYPGNINRAERLNGIVSYIGWECKVKNCYSACEHFGEAYSPIVSLYDTSSVTDCYTLRESKFQENGAATVVSYEEFISSDFIQKIDNQTASVFSAWLKDENNMNDGFPITVADYNYAIGKCKIQPEAWILSGEKIGGERILKADLAEGSIPFKLDCYYNESEPVVTIEDTDIAEISGKYGNLQILLKKKGETKIRVHLEETENTCGADYQMTLRVKDASEEMPKDDFLIKDGVLKEYSGTDENVVIPEGVTSIGEAAFFECTAIKSIHIPEGVTNIGKLAFEGCSALVSIELPESTVSIGIGAFALCSSLRSITIPKKVTSIGKLAFYECREMTIYGMEDSYAQRYAKEYDIPFISIGGQEAGSISAEEMEKLIEKNKTENVVIQTGEGLAFTFEKGTMMTVEGKDMYDFGAKISKDYSSLLSPSFTEDEFAFRIDYNYEGELPGMAQISIPVDDSLIGKRLYYYEVGGNGEYKYMSRTTVAADGTYTVKQNKCLESYIATTKAPEKLGNCDGVDGVTSSDALAVLRHEVGITQTNFDARFADCDGQEGITSSDALAILRYEVGVIDKLY